MIRIFIKCFLNAFAVGLDIWLLSYLFQTFITIINEDLIFHIVKWTVIVISFIISLISLVNHPDRIEAFSNIFKNITLGLLFISVISLSIKAEVLNFERGSDDYMRLTFPGTTAIASSIFIVISEFI